MSALKRYIDGKENSIEEEELIVQNIEKEEDEKKENSRIEEELIVQNIEKKVNFELNW